MQSDPAKIVAGLTEKHRESILNAEDLMSNRGGYPFLTVRHTGELWPVGVAQFRTLKTDRLTPLGLAVLAHLKGTSDE